MRIRISCAQVRPSTMETSLPLLDSLFSVSFSSIKLSINPKLSINNSYFLPPPQPYSRSTITPTPSTTALTISSFATATTTSSTDQIIPLCCRSPVAYDEEYKIFKACADALALPLVRPPSMDINCFTDITHFRTTSGTHFLSPPKHLLSSDLPSLSIVKLKKTISPKNSFNTLISLSRPPQYPRSTFTLRCVATSSDTATATATTTSSTPSSTAKSFEGLCYVVGDNIGTHQLGSDSPVGLPSSYQTPFFEAGEFKSKYCVIIAGQNFCCGSFGELVTRALEAVGIHTVVAESYARTCVSNSVYTGKVHLLESDMRIRDENRTGDVVAIVLGVGEPLLINRTTGKEYRLKHSAGDAKSVTGDGAISKTVTKTSLEIDVLGKKFLSLRGEGEKVSMGKTAEKAS